MHSSFNEAADFAAEQQLKQSKRVAVLRGFNEAADFAAEQQRGPAGRRRGAADASMRLRISPQSNGQSTTSSTRVPAGLQ